jgi:predicted nucleic acid-binding protein
MQATIISDTSCLILLDTIDELNLLEALFGQVLTTQTVADEFGKTLPEWIRIKNPKDPVNQFVLETSLDKGEASAIALALEQTDCLLIIDELKGRRLAKRLA